MRTQLDITEYIKMTKIKARLVGMMCAKVDIILWAVYFLTFHETSWQGTKVPPSPHVTPPHHPLL